MVQRARKPGSKVLLPSERREASKAIIYNSLQEMLRFKPFLLLWIVGPPATQTVLELGPGVGSLITGH